MRAAVAISILLASTSLGRAATLTTLVDFNQTDGEFPYYGPLIADSSGDLIGTASGGGGNTYNGVVFEVVKTSGGFSSTPTILGRLCDSCGGSSPEGGVIMGPGGNLFGETVGVNGTVFEIKKTSGGYSNTITGIFGFNGTDGSDPLGALVMDSAGIFFGSGSGAANDANGNVFEVKKTSGGYSSTPTVLFSFNRTDGIYPQGALILDSSGDIFGTAEYGGNNNKGVVFELKKSNGVYDSTPTMITLFNGTDGATPAAGLLMDKNGNLFGTTQFGGAHNDGTVFEIASMGGGTYASTPTVPLSFDGADGQAPQSGLIEDAAGDLFGATYSGGAYSEGTVFDLPYVDGAYASTPVSLFSFDSADGAHPLSTLLADSEGDLFGTTLSGNNGAAYGTVFEITNAGYVTANVPEPASLALLVAGLAGIGLVRSRRSSPSR